MAIEPEPTINWPAEQGEGNRRDGATCRPMPDSHTCFRTERASSSTNKSWREDRLLRERRSLMPSIKQSGDLLDRNVHENLQQEGNFFTWAPQQSFREPTP